MGPEMDERRAKEKIARRALRVSLWSIKCYKSKQWLKQLIASGRPMYLATWDNSCLSCLFSNITCYSAVIHYVLVSSNKMWVQGNQATAKQIYTNTQIIDNDGKHNKQSYKFLYWRVCNLRQHKYIQSG